MITKTLSIDDNPHVSLLLGHHTPETFDKAFEAEGWSGDPWSHDLIAHEYWIENPDKSWKKSQLGEPGAQAVTVGYW